MLSYANVSFTYANVSQTTTSGIATHVIPDADVDEVFVEVYERDVGRDEGRLGRGNPGSTVGAKSMSDRVGVLDASKLQGDLGEEDRIARRRRVLGRLRLVWLPQPHQL